MRAHRGEDQMTPGLASSVTISAGSTFPVPLLLLEKA